MAKAALEVADILRRHLDDYPYPLSNGQARAFRDIQICRTAVLGGNRKRCCRCSYEQISYNSCCNRHCPKCQSGQRARWTEKQLKQLLPVHYFHLVFTVPDELNCLVAGNQTLFYNILFQATNLTLTTIAADPKHLGAKIGFLAVLHTWGQTLQRHPHLHCIVPGGGMAPDGLSWVETKKDFFLPVHVLGAFFRNRFLELLNKAYQKGQLSFFGETEKLAQAETFKAYMRPLKEKKWVVYSQPPFGGPDLVVKYLARYTHRVAISNQRILKLSEGRVTFSYKDYRDGKNKKMTLQAQEFIRRFSQHILPLGFRKIRYFGTMALANRKRDWTLARLLIGLANPDTKVSISTDEVFESWLSHSPKICPHCKLESLEVVEEFPTLAEVYRNLKMGASYSRRVMLAVVEQSKKVPARKRGPP